MWLVIVWEFVIVLVKGKCKKLYNWYKVWCEVGCDMCYVWGKKVLLVLCVEWLERGNINMS